LFIEFCLSTIERISSYTVTPEETPMRQVRFGLNCDWFQVFCCLIAHTRSTLTIGQYEYTKILCDFPELAELEYLWTILRQLCTEFRSSMTNMDRNQNIGRLANEEFDVIVVGGGITGACVAYDAARRGLSVALLEKDDFGGATSAASSKVLHGGIRYLQQARPDKVRESALERIYFQNLVPHLCGYVPFMIPTYAGVSKGRAALFAASIAYYLATLGQNKELRNRGAAVEPAYMIDRNEVGNWVPWLLDDKSVTGALMLPECHMKSSERVTWSIIQGAVSYGAAVANYVSAEGLGFEGSTVTGISARDSVEGSTIDVAGKIVANCSGPWIGGLAPNNMRSSNSPITAFSRGSHILLRGKTTRCAIALPTTQKIQGIAGRGGRHMFMIPWRSLTLVGTSYAPQNGPLDSVAPTEDDIEQLRTGINAAVGHEFVASSNIVHAYAGVYPLTAQNVSTSVYQGTGDYKIIDHGKQDSVDGFISVFGAKFTTARILAEKACDLIARKIGKSVDRCATRYDPVPAANFGNLDDYLTEMKAKYSTVISQDQIERIVTSFGTDSVNVLDLAQQSHGLRRLLGASRTNIAAEIVFSARHEMLVHLDDLVCRRSGIGELGNPGGEILRACADLVGAELGWSGVRRAQELERSIARFPIALAEAN
jgi:glycerol-3-phosphate dehydrogenase